MDSVAEINLTCNGEKVVVEQFFYIYTPSIWFRRRDLDTSGLHVWGLDPRAVECLSDCTERERERERNSLQPKCINTLLPHQKGDLSPTILMQHHFSVGLAGMTFEHTRPGSGMGLCFSFHKGCSEIGHF